MAWRASCTVLAATSVTGNSACTRDGALTSVMALIRRSSVWYFIVLLVVCANREL